MGYAEFSKTSYPKANKDHNGTVAWQHFEWMNSYRDEQGRRRINQNELDALKWTAEDAEILHKHMDNNFKISKGEKYYYQSGMYEGDFYSVKYPLEIHNLIDKYDLYIED